MKRLLFAICLLVPLTMCVGQRVGQLGPKSITKGKIYALIIGISDYKDDGIRNLQFAHRDAQEFADYLGSKAGGSVPPAQIKLLTGEEATVANIYTAKKWLEESTTKGDLVFFYFAGHGDVESDLYQLGFLLAYDTPEKNYLNNAVRIEDINNMANTLSVNKEVTTILITDACRSGKLVGEENKGKRLVGEQLAKVQKNEIRLTSCAANELSEEDLAWGGGRGAFSYYLINGMKGLADSEKEADGKISLLELSTYLKTKVSADVNKLKEAEQNPEVDGKPTTTIALVDPAELATLNNVAPIALQLSASTSRSASQAITPMERFFKFLRTQPMEEKMDFRALHKFTGASLIDQLAQSQYLQKATLEKILTEPLGPEQKELVSKVLQDLPLLQQQLVETTARMEFQTKFAAAIHDRMQYITNLYLSGNEAELNRRSSQINSGAGYGVYPSMLETASELVDKSDYLHHILQVKLHYFSGLAARINLSVVANSDSLIDIALREQQLALALDEKSAYVHNEIGLLLMYKKSFAAAETHFKRAFQLVPTWSIPVANLSNLYCETNQYEAGVQLGEKALQLQPTNRTASYNIATNYDQLGNLLFAEALYHKSMSSKTLEYLPYEKLAYLHLKLTNYAKADSFFMEADLRKDSQRRATAMEGSPRMPFPHTLEGRTMEFVLNKTDTSKFDSKDVIAHFAYAKIMLETYELRLAERFFRKAIAIDPADPLAYFYLAVVYHHQQRYAEAETCVQAAERHYLDSAAFLEHCKNLQVKFPATDKTLEKKYRESHFPMLDMAYHAGEIYTKWNHINEGIDIYQSILRKDHREKKAYQKLWALLENTGQYDEVENIIQNYRQIEKVDGEAQLLGFYNRRLAENDKNPSYLLKAANLTYSLVKEKNDGSINALAETSISFYTQYLALDKRQLRSEDSLQFLIRMNANYVYRWPDKLESSTGATRAMLYSKLGDLESWLDSTENAAKYYEIAVGLAPTEASTRHQLVDHLNTQLEYPRALHHLSNLQQNKQTNATKQVLLANYLVRAGKFSTADSLVGSIEQTVGSKLTELAEIRGKSALLSKSYDKGIKIYQKLSEQQPNDASLHYTLCRINVAMGKTQAALQSLKKAIAAGFDYKWVLSLDPSLEGLRSTADFQKIFSTRQ
jgi:Flp pilus assembly protein TadD